MFGVVQTHLKRTRQTAKQSQGDGRPLLLYLLHEGEATHQPPSGAMLGKNAGQPCSCRAVPSAREVWG